MDVSIMKVMPNTEKLDLIFLIDRSGSMYGSEMDTIGGFNSFLDKERANGFDTNVTTVLFNHQCEMLYKRKSIDEVKNLTKEEYFVRGSTALLDAIGKTVTLLEREIKNKVLFVIMTDGMENASVEFSKSQIKNMITNHEWEFIFIGADIDSYAEAGSIGIKRSRVANYVKSKEGIGRAYDSVSNVTRCMRANADLDSSNWKKDLEEFD